MPRIFGLNLTGLLVTSVAFFALGFVWYDVLFAQKWMVLMGMDATATGGPLVLPLALGFANVLIVSLGLGLFLKWLNVSTLLTAVKYGLIACVCFALTTIAYDVIYAGRSLTLFVLNGAYNVVGYAMVAAIWTFFK